MYFQQRAKSLGLKPNTGECRTALGPFSFFLSDLLPLPLRREQKREDKIEGGGPLQRGAASLWEPLTPL